jgi:hypothetical protein
MGHVQFPTVSFLTHRYTYNVAYKARTMSFIYSFPPIIQSQPPVAIPYDDTPELEGKQELSGRRSTVTNIDSSFPI